MGSWYPGPSRIHGRGAFASQPIGIDRSAGLLINGYKAGGLVDTRTSLGKLINHQSNPNGRMEKIPSTDMYYLRALRDIDTGEELTMDYNDTPEFVATPEQIDPDNYKAWG